MSKNYLGYGSNLSGKYMAERVPNKIKAILEHLDFLEGEGELPKDEKALWSMKVGDEYEKMLKDYLDGNATKTELRRYFGAYLENLGLTRKHLKKLLGASQKYTDAISESRKRGILEGYHLVINKIFEKNPKQGYANIVETSPDVVEAIRNGELVGVILPWVEGAVYEIPDEFWVILEMTEGIHKDKPHYHEMRVTVKVNNRDVQVVTFAANPDKTGYGIYPTKSYKDKILEGRDLFSPKYLQEVERMPTYEEAVR